LVVRSTLPPATIRQRTFAFGDTMTFDTATGLASSGAATDIARSLIARSIVALG
jgi:hypothetical protein